MIFFITPACFQLLEALVKLLNEQLILGNGSGKQYPGKEIIKGAVAGGYPGVFICAEIIFQNGLADVASHQEQVSMSG